MEQNQLLDREPDEAYIAEWTALLQGEAASEGAEDRQAVVVFRIGGEWLAISTQVFAEVAELRPLHRIPHRSGKLLLGVINLRGQLTLCVSLKNLLELESVPNEGDRRQYKRLVSVRKGTEGWIFPVDEVYGNVYCTPSMLQNVPVTVAKSTANFLRAVMAWKGKNVGYLDEELLFQSLRRGIA